MAQRQQRLGAAPAPAPSQTVTEPQRPSARTEAAAPRILRLRGQHNPDARTVQWAEDVVDNEGLGRKSSKVCCIYHKPKAAGESSDESSSSSDSDSSSGADSDDGAKRKAMDADRARDHMRGRGRRSRKHGGKEGADKAKRPPSPNAYEKVPKVKGKGKEEAGGGGGGGGDAKTG